MAEGPFDLTAGNGGAPSCLYHSTGTGLGESWIFAISFAYLLLCVENKGMEAKGLLDWVRALAPRPSSLSSSSSSSPK